jgi:multidrug efflux system membrane fusion protein
MRLADMEPALERSAAYRRRWWLVLALALAVLGVVIAFERLTGAQQPGRRPAGGDAGPTPVIVATAKTGDVNVYLAGLGTVTPLETVTVRSRVDGQLMAVHFKEGQMVRAGQLLAEIDPRPFRVQLEQAEGQLAHDEALLANARVDLDRYRTLLKQDSIAEQQVATQEALVKQYQGTVKLDQAQIDNAKLQLTYSRITAPISGRLGLRLVDAGNVVHASDANGLVLITRLQPITVVFAIPQDSLPGVLRRMHEGGRIPVEALGREDTTRLASGWLLAIDNQIDPATGTVKLKAEFANEDGRLFPQQFVNVRMLTDTQRGVVTVPSSAVQRGTQGLYVFLVKPDDSVTLRGVKLGPSEGGVTAVNSGIAAGDRVVVDGTDRLREGVKVTPTTREAAQAAAARPAGKRGKRRAGGS